MKRRFVETACYQEENSNDPRNLPSDMFAVIVKDSTAWKE